MSNTRYLMSMIPGKRKYKLKISIRRTRRVDFGARMIDDQLAALRKRLEKVSK